MLNKKFFKTNAFYLREKLKESNRCHYCNVALTKARHRHGFPVIIPQNQATIDHVYSKLDIRRRAVGGSKKIVLSCYKCNQNKNIIETCMLRNTTYELLHPANISLINLINQ